MVAGVTSLPVAAISYYIDSDLPNEVLSSSNLSYLGLFDIVTDDGDGSGSGLQRFGYDPLAERIISFSAKFSFLPEDSFSSIEVLLDGVQMGIGEQTSEAFSYAGGKGNLSLSLLADGRLNYIVNYLEGTDTQVPVSFRFEQAWLGATAAPIPDMAATSLLLGLSFGGLVILRKKTGGNA